MSDNNQNKGAKQKDSFVKPGDENIVSGKSFFLSFGKQKKGPANPLLESEKNKNSEKNREQTAKNEGKKQNNSQQENANRKNAPDNDKQKDINNKGKNHNHDRKHNNQNQGKAQNRDESRNTKPAVKQEEKHITEAGQEKDGQNKNFRNHRNDNKKNKNQPKDREINQAKSNQPTENAGGGVTADKPQNNQGNRHGKHPKHGGTDSRKAQNNNNVRDAQSVPANIRPEEKNANEKAPAPVKNDKSDRNHNADMPKRPKHKKEKFIPSAPDQEIKSEDLSQPIIDKAGIASSVGKLGGGMRLGKSGFGIGKDTSSSAGTENEPRYIDRNRPLAEQIIEQSKPRTYKTHLTENTDTVEVIGVRFREAGKVYYFAPGENKVAKDQAVIVETARGVEYGFCAIANRFVSTDNIVPPLKPIVRVATTDDTERYESNKQLEAGAAKIFREKVRELGLEMSLVYVEYTFDNGKLLFYFTADGRVDFRELIKELASAFKTRIELRQIGVRDEAKIVGGLGICGRPVCCKSFLGEFSQVSIKMAKDQNLFINSSKISGTCGRFMCCIRYEDEVYQKEYEKTPKVDAIVETPEGKGVVVESNALKGTVKVLLDNKPDSVATPFESSDVKLLGYIKRANENDVPDGVDIPDEGSGS